MNKGETTVGHPVNVATGVVYQSSIDASLPGRLPLVFERSYSTAKLDNRPGALGQGWSIPFESSLEIREDGFHLITPQGDAQHFEDPERKVASGARLLDEATFQELEKSGDEYVLTQWDNDSGSIDRYCYQACPGQQYCYRLARIEDVTGLSSIRILWDEQGKISALHQSAENRFLRFGYDQHDRIVRLTLVGSENGTRINASYQYDHDGRLCSVTDSINRTQSYTYDADGRLIRECQKDGGVFSFDYDGKGRCIRTSGIDNYDAKSIRYFETTAITQVTDSYGHTSTYQCLPTGQVASESDPLGATRTTTYDEYGRIGSITNPGGGVSTYKYDEHGNLTRISKPDGSKFTTVFNDCHQPVEMIDEAGQSWLRHFDAQHKLTKTVNPEGGITWYKHDRNGNIVQMKDAQGGISSYTFDSRNIPESYSPPNEKTQRFRIDEFGRLERQIDSDGNDTFFQYDNADRLVAFRQRDGSTVSYQFDNGDNVTRIVGRDGETKRFRYGPCGRLIEEIDPLGHSVKFKWGTEPGRIAQIENAKGEKYLFQYSPAGRIVGQQTFDGRVIESTFDPNGNCVRETVNGQFTTTFDYDNNGCLIRKTSHDGLVVEFERDVFGRIIAANNDECKITYDRDFAGRIIKEQQGEHSIERSYNSLGKLVSLGTSLGHSCQYDYDLAGCLTSVKTMGAQSLDFELSDVGLDTCRQLPGGASLGQEFNPLNQLVSQTLTEGGRVVLERELRYDGAGELERRKANPGKEEFFQYDEYGRLKTYGTERRAEEYSYDANGNIATVATTGQETQVANISPGNRLASFSEYQYEYDSLGRLIAKKSSREDGTEEVLRYAWNGNDQLVEFENANGEKWKYFYDALGRRIRKEGANQKVEFIWNQFDILHEIEKDEIRTWVHDPDYFRPLIQIEQDEVYSIVGDDLGTPSELIDTRGNIVWQRNDDVWGRPTPDAMPTGSRDCPLRFPGQYRDEESGLHYNCFRYYAPDDARYISPDPIGFVGGLNEYGYCHNPVGWIDPYGLNDGCGAGDEETVTVFRVQGGRALSGQPGSRHRIHVDDNGNVRIDQGTLNISMGDMDHARYFQTRRPGSTITSFEIPKSVADRIHAEAIPQRGYRSNPNNNGGTAPKIVDPNQPGNSYELPPSWSGYLQENAVPGSGRVE